MKFGRNLPRNQVPQWASEYINYKGLKKLIKLAAQRVKDGQEADLAEFFYTLDRNLETVDGFYNKKYAELARRLRLLYDRYGEDAPSQADAERHELSDVVNALLDLRTHFRNLQWYGEVNRRGFNKILKKLDKKVPAVNAQQRYLVSRVDPRPFATNQQLSQNMSSINAWLSKVGDLKPSEGPSSARSSFSITRPKTSVDIPPEIATALDNALMDDDTRELEAALSQLQKTTAGADDADQGLLLGFLQRAMFHKSPACIPVLLKHIDSLDDEEDFHARNCIHRLLINVGRARAAQAGQSTQTSPDIDPMDSIAPAEAPALTLNPYGLKELDSSRLVTGTDDTAKLVRVLLDSLTGDQRSALSARDDSGRLPLHYAAKYGFVDITRNILEKMLAWGQLDTSKGLSSISWDDVDGYTPMHLAVVSGWRLTTEILLETCRHFPELDVRVPLRTWPRAVDLLCMATRANFYRILGLLLNAGADANMPDQQGETPLHIAARFGHAECAAAILEAHTVSPINLNVPENTFGWTPLFVAAVDGHEDIVRLLIRSGAELNRMDSSGWTAKEHAALRGHMDIAELLAAHTPKTVPPSPELNAKISDGHSRMTSVGDRGSIGISKESTNSRVNIPPPVKSFGHRYLQKDNMVLVSLGSMDQRKNQKPIQLDSIPLSEAHATQLDTALSVVVSANGAHGDESIVDLPVQENISTEPFAFTTQDVTKVKLFFDIVPTYAGSSDDKVGRAVAMLSSIKPNVGSKRINLQGDVSVPIMATKTMEVIGTVNFNFLIVTPFTHERMSISETHTYWKSLTEPMVIGHRGLGKNEGSRKSLQLGENTIGSFIAAANLGATYVEFDVQLTKDHVPVIYHDFLVSETGIDAPVHALTLEQFLHVSQTTPQQGTMPPTPPLGPQTNGHGEQNSRSGRETPIGRQRTHRANSLSSLNSGSHQDLMSERMKHTRDFKLKGYKGNSRGNFIQEPFTTLEEMFRRLPVTTGFNIEMKYPMLFESEEQEMDTYAVELNAFVDTVLKMVYDLNEGGRRNIIFSSFHPDICLLLSLKQPSIPILFLTDAGTSSVGDIRASSLQEAIRFASRWNLLGVVSAAEPLVMCPRLVRVVKESGLVCVSYGTLNNDPENVKLQVREGIDAVIVDNVLAVRRGLTADESKKVMGSREAQNDAVEKGVNGEATNEEAMNGKAMETVVNGVPLREGRSTNGAVV